MDDRIRRLVVSTKEKFGLKNYYLKRYQLNRHVNIFQDTIYTLSMEWFPQGAEETEDGSNPVGTAVIEMDIHNQTYKSVIFVGGETYAQKGIRFDKTDKQSIIRWIEEETGLTYEKQFKLQSEEVGHLLFQSVFEDVQVVPSCSIQLRYDHVGHLTLFSVNGYYPIDKMFKTERYTLSLDQLGPILKEQLKFIHLPIYEEKKLLPIYAVEEVYLTNDQKRKIPFSDSFDLNGYRLIDKRLTYGQRDVEIFERKEIELLEEVTTEQAFSLEKSPEAYPITKEEEEACIKAVKTFLAEVYPKDSERWVLKTLHREANYIHAALRFDDHTDFVFKRKLMVMIDASSYRPVNYLDNQEMLDMFAEFEQLTKVKLTKNEAYEILKDHYDLQACYVYDYKQKQYILCGKLDGHYGVNAITGELVSLEDLS